MLSAETTEEETTWSLGEYITGKSIWEAFKLPGSPPGRSGFTRTSPRLSAAARRKRGVCVLLADARRDGAGIFGLPAPARGFSQALHVSSNAGRAVFRDRRVRAQRPDLERRGLRLRPTSNNNWVYFNFTLINLDTGQAYDFGREVSYYHGSDSDGAWTEGDPSDTVTVPRVRRATITCASSRRWRPTRRRCYYDLRGRSATFPSGAYYRDRRLAADRAAGVFQLGSVHSSST